jgi:formamidopyrimidine-DNA glycosylase
VPELPDVTVYVETLTRFIAGRRIESIRLASPFLLRTFDPPIADAVDKKVLRISRIGKRIVWHLEGDLFLVFHLMIAGRYHWKRRGAALSRKTGLAAFDFDNGSLFLTEASSKKRASLHVIRGEANLADFHQGGVEPLDTTLAKFAAALRSENHTLKRSMTDPRIVSGVGNAYSDEILHRARLSPVLLTQKMSDEDIKRLFDATKSVLKEWTDRLRKETGEKFPEKVTAFHDEMAVHGKFGKPCPVCASPVQRIVKAENETNYCATCQTDGKILADRSLSRLLGEDWPRSFDELEERRQRLSMPGSGAHDEDA